MARSDERRDRVSDSDRAENRVEQAGEALVEVLAAERVQPRRSDRPLLDHAGLAQHAKVMGARRLRDLNVERAARTGRRIDAQLAHEAQPLGVAEGVEHGRQLEILCSGMVSAHDYHCTTFIELLLRWSSYIRNRRIPRCQPDHARAPRPTRAGRSLGAKTRRATRGWWLLWRPPTFSRRARAERCVPAACAPPGGGCVRRSEPPPRRLRQGGTRPNVVSRKSS